jgi:NhaP-type Na+/H+ or K+/H+ antiporter/mannitol/fructose-specific phosphotransferase system IIA component (Ntr-type)
VLDHFLLAAVGTTPMIRTIAAAIAFGVLLIALARRLGLPAIVLLLAGGVLLGPATLGEHAIVEPETLGTGLPVIVALSIGLILFEGGLTLDLGGYRTAPVMIKRLLTIGVLITWAGGALAAWLIGGIELRFAILAGAMVIVTGPTVITPLLKRLDVNERLHSILHWEGVLIDPLGVFLAVLCFEVVVSGLSGPEAAAGLLLRVIAGVGFGTAGGFLLSLATRRRLIPDDMTNVVALAAAVLVFGLAEMVRQEAGLLAATVAGFVFAITGPKKVKRVREFKAEITDLLIGTLFLLLSARLSFGQFVDFGWTGLVAVLVMMFLVRPIAVAVCSTGPPLSRNERIFLAWVAPRGIVAASLASLFAISIAERFPDAKAAASFVETFVYSVIIATIVGQGLSAGLVARVLGLKREEANGWMIVGAHAFGARVAEFLHQAGLPVVLVDTNPRAARQAELRGIAVVTADACEIGLRERSEWRGIGNVLALTDNEDLNIRICQTWSDALGPAHVFRADPSQRETPGEREPESGTIVWPRLPKPGLLAAELQRGQASLLSLDAHDEAALRMATPVATVDGTELRFEPPDKDEPLADGVQVLALRRTAEHLLWSLRPELILDLEPTDLDGLFQAVVDAMVKVAPSLSREQTVRELLDRESTFPTVLGHGVALPHAYATGLDGRLCAIVRMPAPGMHFGTAASGLPVGDGPGPDADATDAAADRPHINGIRLIFCLLSPKGDPEGHLASLAEIARLVADEDVRQRLLAATSPLEVIGIVGERATEN